MIELVLILVSFSAFFWVLFEKSKINHAFVIALGVAPAVISIELQFLYLFFPSYSNSFYRIVFILTATALAFLSLKINKQGFTKLDFKKIAFTIIPVLISLYVFSHIPKSFDIFDPISYGILGKIFFNSASLSDYPFVNISREVFNFSWFTHPLGIPLIYSFLYLFDSSILINFVSSYYYFLTTLLVFWFLFEERGIMTAILGTTLSMLVPVMVYLGKDGFAGPFRIFFFTVLIIIFAKIKDEKPIISGFFTGLAMNTHLIGILAFPSSFFLFIKNKKLNFKGAFFHGVIAILVGSFSYVNNFLKFGSFNTTTYLSSFYPKFAKEFIKWHLDRKGIDSISTMLSKGILGPFTGIQYFGLFFWITVVLFIINRKKILKSSIFFAFIPFFALFLFFHLNPSLTNTFHMDSRYIATFIPGLIIVVFYGFEKKWKNTILAFVVLSSVIVGYREAPWFYKSRKVEFQSIVDYINTAVPQEDAILSRRFPFTQYYCDNHKTYSILDPKISSLLKANSLNEFLQLLKKNKIKYILTSRDDGHPFENKTFVKEIIKFPKLATLAFKTKGNGFWLYKINKYKINGNTKNLKKSFCWTVNSPFPVVSYKNKKNDIKFFINFEEKGVLLTIPYANSSSIFALSKEKVWKKNAEYIPTTEGVYKLVFTGYSLVKKIKISPFVFVYDKKGNRIKSFSGYCYIKKESKQYIVNFKKKNIFKSTDYMVFPKGTVKAIIGINFYSDKGVVFLENIYLEKVE